MEHYRCIIVIFAVLFFSSCKKEKEETDSCSSPYVLVQGGTSIGVSADVEIISGGYNDGFFEIEYGANGFKKGTGTKQTVEYDPKLYDLDAGTYDIYARKNCGGDSWSKWSEPKSFLVQKGQVPVTCFVPGNLYVSEGLVLNWDETEKAIYYEVEYGTVGFKPGAGTRAATDETYYLDGIFRKGTVYDFYVRTRCNGNEYSEWSEAKTFLATQDYNLCLKPSNVVYYGIYSSLGNCTGVEFFWDHNGEREWEYTLVGRNANPDLGNIYSSRTASASYKINCSNNYDFYVRAICANGNKTEWTGPKKY